MELFLLISDLFHRHNIHKALLTPDFVYKEKFCLYMTFACSLCIVFASKFPKTVAVKVILSSYLISVSNSDRLTIIKL